MKPIGYEASSSRPGTGVDAALVRVRGVGRPLWFALQLLRRLAAG